MGTLTKNDKDYIEARIAYAQSQLEEVKQRITEIQEQVLNPLRTILLKAQGKDVA